MDEFCKKVSQEELTELANKKGFVNLVGLMDPRRPGVLLFCVKFACDYFRLSAFKDKELLVHTVEWEGMQWVIMTIPEELMKITRKIVDEVGLRIADGVPTGLFYPPSVFPINSKNTFTLESKPGSPIYTSDARLTDQLIEEEDEKIEKILKEYEATTER